jgi:site-specific DNA recombinase
VLSEPAEIGLKRKPGGVGIDRLRDPPAEESRQFEALGINPE